MHRIVACMGANRELGKNGKMMWHNEEELKHFNELTKGRVVIMGRVTAEEVNYSLPNRKVVTVSRKGLSLEDALNMYPDSDILGGQEIYEQSISKVDMICLSILNETFKGADRFFPEVPENFKKIKEEKYTTYIYVEYERIKERE